MRANRPARSCLENQYQCTDIGQPPAGWARCGRFLAGLIRDGSIATIALDVFPGAPLCHGGGDD